VPVADGSAAYVGTTGGKLYKLDIHSASQCLDDQFGDILQMSLEEKNSRLALTHLQGLDLFKIK